MNDTWISEDLEPVAIKFAWERRPASHQYSEADCVCPKALAAHLIHSLFAGSEQEEMADMSYVRQKRTPLSNRPSELRAN